MKSDGQTDGQTDHGQEIATFNLVTQTLSNILKLQIQSFNSTVTLHLLYHNTLFLILAVTYAQNGLTGAQL